jgi:cyclomaltodextrin glucanotransferase
MSSGASRARTEMALALILTCRGTPFVYYGTEQYLHNDTNGGADPYNRPMMENWDTGTPAFKLVGKLAKVRKENRAVQSGSHRQKYHSADVYAYTRVYRGSCCLAVFNRGAAATLALEKIELPDGAHKDALSDAVITVKGGRIEGLYIGRDTSMVFSWCEPPRPKAALELGFILNGFTTNYGERVKVTGNCPELGNWDLDKAFTLEYINENVWLGNLPVTQSAGKLIAYKFIIEKPEGGVFYENRPAHFRHLPAEGFVELQHRWV